MENEKKISYYEKNKELIKLKQIEYNKNNPEKIKANAKKYREKNAENERIRALKNYEANKEKSIAYTIKWQKENKDKRNQHLREKRALAKLASGKPPREPKPKPVKVPRVPKTPEQIKESRKAYYHKRMANDPLFRVRKNVRSLISMSIKNTGNKKSLKSELILGCTFQQFKEHLESQFESWMNWDNFGNPKDGIFEPNKTWDIDHIIPTSSALTESDIIKLNHYTNLKPLCTYINRWVKGSKL